MAKKKAAKPKKQPPAKPTPAPRQKTLPGMQDRKITALENAALTYADIRDQRMGWTKQEVDAKKKVQQLMHDQKRTHYERGNIEIDLVPEGEHVRVRVRDREEPVDEPVDNPPAPVDEPESEEEELPREEPEDPDQEYDSSQGLGREVKDEPSDF